MPKMYSSEDLEKLYFDYQTEWMPRGISIQAYCSRNNVPYKVLDRWIRDIYKRAVPVQIAGAPEELKIENHCCPLKVVDSNALTNRFKTFMLDLRSFKKRDKLR